MKVPEGTEFPGPRAFPAILMLAGYVLSALLVVHFVRHPEKTDESEPVKWRTHSDWAAVAWCVGGFLVFASTLETLGWLIAAAIMFWTVAKGMGSHRPIFDISLAFTMSGAIYLAFDFGLGLNLPAGILGGVL